MHTTVWELIHRTVTKGKNKGRSKHRIEWNSFHIKTGCSVRTWIIEVILTSQTLVVFNVSSHPKSFKDWWMFGGSLVVKHTLKVRSCLPLCSLPVWSTQTGPDFPLNPGNFLSAENDPYLWQNIKNVNWKRQNPVRPCTVYMQDWKGNPISMFWPRMVLATV